MRILWPMLFLITNTPAFAEEEWCLNAPYNDTSTADAVLLAEIYSNIAPVLLEIPLLNTMDKRNTPSICLADNLDGAVAYFDAEASKIMLRRGEPPEFLSGVLLHELRHFEQFSRGYCPSNDVSMQENARAVFAMEADASAVSLLAAWILKEDGHAETWVELANWKTQKDIAQRFAETMRRGAGTPKALSNAFSQWYASEERKKEYYTTSCSEYLDRQDFTKALPKYDLLPVDFFEKLCVLPGGLDYPCYGPRIEP